MILLIACFVLIPLSFLEVECQTIKEEKYNRDSCAHYSASQADEIFKKRDKYKDRSFDTAEMLKAAGYESEFINVPSGKRGSTFGYELGMYRITKNRKNTPMNKGPVVVMHGLLCSSDDWLYFEPGDALPHMLADNGYDVWLPNSRGNKYSNKHKSILFKPDLISEFWQISSRYWDFTFHELGTEDVPVVIKYILGETKFKNLHWIGHSQGTAQFFIAASSPESEHEYVNNAVKIMVAYTPVANISRTKSPIRILSPGEKLGSVLTRAINTRFSIPTTQMEKLSDTCQGTFTSRIVCSSLIMSLVGWSPEETNCTRLPEILAHCPSDTSTKNIMHYMQLINKRRFLKYDNTLFSTHHWELDRKNYDLTKIKTKIQIYYGEKDLLTVTKDVEELAEIFKKNGNLINSTLLDWNHLDFMWGMNAPQKVYGPTIDLLKNHSLTPLDPIESNSNEDFW